MKQVEETALALGTTKDTAKNALKDVRDAAFQAYNGSNYVPKRGIASKKAKNPKNSPNTNKTKKKSRVSKTVINPSNVQNIINQIGKKQSSTAIPKIPIGMEFPHFCKLHSYPHYNGLYRWQIQWFNKIWPKKITLTKVARDHGKSIGHGNLSQWVMTQGWDVMYLGWTDKRKDIAKSVYQFFLIRGEIDRTIKNNSEYHFTTIYGTKFDTYSVQSKDILGMHEVGALEREIVDENRYLEDYVRDETRKLLMIIDDPIDDSFKDFPHKAKALERRYESTITNINANKTLVTGTHKYEGDFLHYIEDTHSNCYVYKRGTHIPEDDPRFDTEPDNLTNLLCPERWIEEGAPHYDTYKAFQDLELTEKEEKNLYNSFHPKRIQKMKDIWIPIFRKKDLTEKKKIVKEYWWYAEYEQDPHAIIGTIFKNIQYINAIGNYLDYDAVTINIDRATTTKTTSDETGITVEAKRADNQHRIVINDLSDKIELLELIKLIEDLFTDLKQRFVQARIKVVVEQQGGGSDFASMSVSLGAVFANDIEIINAKRPKPVRIEDWLKGPVNNGMIKFLTSLKGKKVIYQLEHFPNTMIVDGLDSLATGDFFIRTMRNTDMDPEKIKRILQDRIDTLNSQDGYKDPWDRPGFNQVRGMM